MYFVAYICEIHNIKCVIVCRVDRCCIFVSSKVQTSQWQVILRYDCIFFNTEKYIQNRATGSPRVVARWGAARGMRALFRFGSVCAGAGRRRLLRTIFTIHYTLYTIVSVCTCAVLAGTRVVKEDGFITL